MPLTNLLGEREALTQNSELYKEKIIEYMEAWGFILVGDSSSQGGFPDLVFEKPEIHGNRQAVVEAKWTELSRLEKGFLAELGQYFQRYMNEPLQDRFDFYIFARELQNYRKWRHIFDITLQRQEDVRDYYERVVENEELREDIRIKLEDYSFDDFEQFIGDTQVVQADYDSLLMKIEEFEDSGKFKPQFYTTETEPVEEPEELTANFVKIANLPDKLYIGDEQNIDGPQIPFEGKPFAFPTDFHAGNFYSLLPPDELSEATTQFVVDGSIEEVDFKRWIADDENHNHIAKILFRELILYDAENRGITTESVDPGYRVFYEHKDLSLERRRVEGRVVTRYYKEGTRPFVWHLGASLSIKEFSGEYYIVILPRFLFSSDGKSLIRGEDNKALYDRFSTSRWQNNQKVRERVNFWINALGYGEQTGESKDFDTQLVGLVLDRKPPSDVTVRDHSMEHQTMEEFL